MSISTCISIYVSNESNTSALVLPRPLMTQSPAQSLAISNVNKSGKSASKEVSSNKSKFVSKNISGSISKTLSILGSSRNLPNLYPSGNSSSKGVSNTF